MQLVPRLNKKVLASRKYAVLLFGLWLSKGLASDSKVGNEEPYKES